MASEEKVKRYLAYWLQVGKKVVVHNGQNVLQPRRIIAGDRYSQEFESFWQYLLSPESGDCYLTGTEQTIGELLTSKWDIEPCYRCDLPIPMFKVGLPPESCTCDDLPHWPNNDLPKPREPINTQKHLNSIYQRLCQAEDRVRQEQEGSSPEKKLSRDSLQPQDSLNHQDYLRLVHNQSSGSPASWSSLPENSLTSRDHKSKTNS